MSSIDERIVKMVFDNKEFEKNVETTTNTLENLKTQLKLDGIATSVEAIADRFSTMGIVGMEVIQRLTNAAIDLGKKLSSAVFGQMMTGGKKRALNLEQAYFQLEGLKMDAAAVIENVNYAVDGTAYGLDEAAKVAAQFGASGMQAGDDMASALRAVSGVAAMTGGSYEDIGRIFIKVAGNGRLMGQELLQLSGRGINAAATLAQQLGVTEQQVREMVSKGQISFQMFYEAMHEAFGEHAAKANDTFTGALSNMKAALSRIGADFYIPFLEYARDVFNAIRPFINGIRTAIRPLVDYVIGWMDTISTGLIGFFERLDPSQITQYIQPMIDIFEHLLEIARNVITPIKEAFREIFPKKSHEQAVEYLQWFGEIIDSFKPSAEFLDKLKNIVKGIFSAFSLVKTIVVDVFRMLEYVLWPIVDLLKRIFLGVFEGIANSVTKFTEWYKTSEAVAEAFQKVTWFLGDLTYGLVDFIDRFAEWVRTSPSVKAAFETIKDVVSTLWGVFKSFGQRLGQVFGGLIEGASNFTTAIKEMFRKSDDSAKKSVFVNTLSKLWEIIKALTSKIWGALKDLGKVFSNTLGGIDFDKILKTINSISLGVIAASIKKFLGGGSLLGEGSPLGTFKAMLSSLQDILGGVGKVLEAWTLSIKADALMKIAGAVALLAGALLLLATINPERLASSIAAITLLFTDLMVAMSFMNNMQTGGKGGIKGFIDASSLKKMTSALTSIATAVLILSVALKMVASLDEDAAMRGVLTIAALTTVLVIAVKSLEKVKPERLKTISASMILMATALVIMSSAVKKLASLSFEEMAVGIAGIAALLLTLTLFTQNVGSPEKMISLGVAFNLIAASLLIFTAVIRKMTSLSMEELGKGLLGIGGILGILAAALHLMPKEKLLSSANSILIIGVAMQLLGRTLMKFAGMSWLEMAKGLIMLAGSLGILVIALNNMEGTLAGSAALLVAVLALGLLTPILKSLGKMSWESIFKSLVVVAGALGLLTIAGYAMEPVILIVWAASAAMLMFGAGLTLVGIGLIAISTALTMFVGSFTTSAIIFTQGMKIMLLSLINLIPEILVLIGSAFIGILGVIRDSAKSIIDTVVAIAVAAIQGVKEVIPELIVTLGVILDALLPFLVEYVPKLVASVLDALIGAMSGLIERLPDLIRLGVEIVVGLIKGISESLDDVILALVELFVSAINAVANAISKATSGIAQAIGNLVKAFIGVILEVFKELFSLASGEDALPMIEIMSTAILSLSAAMALAAAAAPAGLTGATMLVKFVGIMALLLAALGGLSRIPGVSELIKDGGKLLSTLGYALGEFVGSIIGGFGAGVTSGLPAIGTNLSLFMENLQPFINGIQKIDSTIFDSVKEIVNIILYMTAASVLDGIASFLFGATSFSKFGEELSTFGPYFAKYYESIKGVKPQVVTSTAHAVGALAELASNLPREGGLLKYITGTKSLKTFGEGLEDFAKSLKAYQTALGTGLNATLIADSANAAKTLSELESGLPKHGGLKSWFVGDSTLASFGKNLEKFGAALSAYQKALGNDIKGDLIRDSAIAAEALVELEAKLPKTGGIKSWFTGKADLGSFGKNLEKFGTALRAYHDALGSDIDGELIESSANAASALAELEANLPVHGGIKSWFTGDADLESFGASLVPFAEGIRDFQEALGDGVKAETIQNAANAALAIAELNQSLPETGGIVQAWSGSKDLGAFAKELKPLGEGILDFQNSLGTDIKHELIESAANAGLTLAEMNAALPNTGGVVEAWSGKMMSLTEFASALPAFGKGLAAFQTSLGDGIDARLIQDASNAGLTLAEIAEKQESFGGLVSIWSGEKQTLEDFGNTLVAFGTSLFNYGVSVTGLAVDEIMTSVRATEALVDISNNLDGSVGGLKALWSSDYTLSDLGTDLVSLGNSLSAYANSIQNINTLKMESVSRVIEILVAIAKDMASIDKTSPMTLFGHDLKRLGEAGIDGFTEAFNTAIPDIQALIHTIMTTVKTKIEDDTGLITTAMKVTIDGLMSEIKDGSVRAKSEGSQITSELFAGIRDGYFVIEFAGKTLMDKLIAGVNVKIEEVKSSLTGPIAQGLALIKGYYTDFYNSGSYLVSGFVKGINDNISSAVTAGSNLGKKTAEATKNALDERSPSRVFYSIGSFAGIAFVGALLEYTKKAEIAGQNMAEASVSGVETALKLAKYVIEEDFDPTIRPVLDLTDVEEGLQYVSAAIKNPNLGINATTSLASNISTMQQKQMRDAAAIVEKGGATISNQFIQNNYSPKELSRIDIYRQTKNQISMMKGVLDKT